MPPLPTGSGGAGTPGASDKGFSMPSIPGVDPAYIIGIIKDLLSGPPKQDDRASAFLKIEGIKGESRDEKHKDEIEVLDFHWGVAQPRAAAASATGAQTTERAHFGDLSFYKAIDRASPDLAYACSSGKHLKSARLQLCRAGDDEQPFMDYTLTDVIITSVRSGGRGFGEKVPIEEISISYAAIEWKYYETEVEGGKSSGHIVKNWNLKTNR